MAAQLLSSLLIAAAAAQRTEVIFNYAWRFHFGYGHDDAGPGPGNAWASAFSPIASCPADATYPDPHRVTSTDCATACAYDPSCLAWIHKPDTRLCSHANASAGCIPAPTNATAVGSARTAPTPLQTTYAFGAAKLPEASAWELVDAPHDGLLSLNGSFSEQVGDQSHGYRVRTVLWYRKTFNLPSAWASGITYLRFEGVMHFSQLWLNGVYLKAHASSYGAFTVRLDNVSGVVFGGAGNVIAVRADASYGSEHWYGGGGLMRPVQLVHLAASAPSFVESGLFIPPELPPADSNGTTVVHAYAEWECLGPTCAPASVRLDLLDGNGAAVASGTGPRASPPPNGGGTVISPIDLLLPAGVALWAPASPSLYRVVATLLPEGASEASDSVNVTVGFRRTRWDADAGFFINGQHIKQRGFSHHNSFAGVGVAMPQRLDLFRAQTARALGSNIWRMSHVSEHGAEPAALARCQWVAATGTCLTPSLPSRRTLMHPSSMMCWTRWGSSSGMRIATW